MNEPVSEPGMWQLPKQGRYVGYRTKVCFNYDTSRTLRGTILRDDVTEPGHTVILLDDGRVVMGTECQYSPLIGQ